MGRNESFYQYILPASILFCGLVLYQSKTIGPYEIIYSIINNTSKETASYDPLLLAILTMDSIARMLAVILLLFLNICVIIQIAETGQQSRNEPPRSTQAAAWEEESDWGEAPSEDEPDTATPPSDSDGEGGDTSKVRTKVQFKVEDAKETLACSQEITKPSSSS